MTADLIRRLLAVADDLDARGYPYAGIVRQAARQLTDGPTCEECGQRFTVGTPASRARSTSATPATPAGTMT